MNTYNREEAIALVGIENVEKVEAIACEATSRVTDNGLMEWIATYEFGEDKWIKAVYFTKQDVDVDIDVIDWQIYYYLIEDGNY